MSRANVGPSLSWPHGSSEMAERIRNFDWSTTPLGPIADWPMSLRFATDSCLGTAVPTILLWGPALTLLHNDAALPMFDTTDSHALGRPAPEALADRWPGFGPHVARVLNTGEGAGIPDLIATLTRDGSPHETHFSVSFGAVRDEFGQVTGVAISMLGTNTGMYTEAELRASEERQAFLLTLSDALRPLTDPIAIQGMAAQLLGEHLRTDRTYYVEFDLQRHIAIINRDYVREGASSLVGTHAFDQFDFFASADQLSRGVPLVVDDVSTDPGTKTAAAAYEALAVRAYIIVPLLKAGRLVAGVIVTQIEPRRWVETDISLIQEVSERTWEAVERARAEAAMQTSEEKYRTLFESIDEGFCLIEILSDPTGVPVDIRFLDINSVYQRLTGQSNPTNKLLSEVAPGTEQYWLDDYSRVAQTGESLRVEQFHEATGRWYSAFASRVGGEKSRQVAIIFDDITERKEHERRQAFLLRLSDALRPLADLVAIEQTVTQVAMDHFGADRCYYCEIDGDHIVIRRDAKRGDQPSVAGSYALDQMPVFRAVLDAGRAFVVDDVTESELVDDPLRRLCLQLGVSSFINVPVVKDGKPVGILCVVQRSPRSWTASEIALAEDVAVRTWEAVERARAETALRTSEEKYRTLFTSIEEGYGLYEMIYDDARQPVDIHVLEVNPAYERLMQRPNAAGKRLTHLAPGLENEWVETLAATVATRQPARFERYNAELDRWFDVYVTPLIGGSESSFAIVFSDVTAQRRATQALRDSEAMLQQRVADATIELRALSQRLLTVQEDERRHLARELHDEIGQLLTGLQLQIAAAGKRNGTEIKEAQTIVRELTERVSQLSMDLRPAPLDTFGLLPALLWHVERFQARTGIEVDLRHHGVERRFPTELEVAAYRTVQEALTNVARHAGVTAASVHLLATDSALTVVIRDRGHGFDRHATAGAGGLSGMRERIKLVNGTVEIESEPGQGVAITAEFPLDDAPAGLN